jgi:hypothetical protein
MEGRFDYGLWLEMTDAPRDEYAATRVPQVLALPGVQRATWWENVCRDRADLPRKLPEFGTLGLYEVNSTFSAPDDCGRHFRRYPRPGQGVLSGERTLGLLLVLVSPRQPDQAQALRDWADFTHIRNIAASDSSDLMITPYENVSGADPRFLHLYELGTRDPEGWFAGMPDRVAKHLGGGPGTPAFDEWAFHPALRILYVNTFRRLDA